MSTTQDALKAITIASIEVCDIILNNAKDVTNEIIDSLGIGEFDNNSTDKVEIFKEVLKLYSAKLGWTGDKNVNSDRGKTEDLLANLFNSGGVETSGENP